MHERVATGRALDILGTLDHFRHLFILQYKLAIAIGLSKNEFNKVELYWVHIGQSRRAVQMTPAGQSG